MTAELKVLHAGEPSLTNPDNPFIHAAAEAMKRDIRQGDGVHPVGRVDSDCRACSIATWAFPSVMMGFGLPDDNLHAPNEKFHLPNFYRGIEAVARYLELLGRV